MASGAICGGCVLSSPSTVPGLSATCGVVESACCRVAACSCDSLPGLSTGFESSRSGIASTGVMGAVDKAVAAASRCCCCCCLLVCALVLTMAISDLWWTNCLFL